LDSAINYVAVAQQGGTIVILMGVKTLRKTLATLMNTGLSPETPAACIEQGTRRSQRVIVSTVFDLPDCVERAEIAPPALIIIGEVVKLREQINWYQKS
jgi:siroheme synthase